MRFFAERRKSAVSLGAIVAFSVMLLGAPLAATPAPQDEQAGERSDQERGQQALEEARQHMDAGRWSKAAEAYAEALRYLPGNEEAVTGFREAQTLLDRGSTIEDVARTTQVLREQARVEFDNAMTRSRELLDQGDFDDAFQQALTAQIKLRQSRNLFPASEFTHRNQQAESRLSEIEQARENARLLEAQQREKEATRTQAVAQEKELERKASEIREFIRQVRRLQQAQKYEEALQVIDRILFLDEQNPTALMLKDLMESMKLYQRYAEVQRRKEIGYSRDLLKGQERMVLPRANRSGPGPKGVSDLMIYPEDWPSLSVMRTGQGGFVDSAQDRAVSQVLNHNAVPIDFTNNTFEQVMNFFQQVSGVNFYVDWKALDQIGVNREDEVSLQLEAVPVGAALDRVLDQLGDDVDRPQYAVVDGILTVSSEEALRRRVSTVVYDIRDLLFEVPYFDNAPDLDLDTALTQGNFGGGQGGGGGGQGGGGGGGFGGGGGGGGGGSGGGGGGGSLFGNPDDDPDRLSRAELVDQIVNIIQDNIDPEGWRDLGGDTGSLQEFNGNLIITNTPRNHRLINGLLAQLREIRALQINIETRVLTVSTDWFEQIGVDLDLFFNTNGTVRGQQLAVDPLGSLSDFFNADGTLKDPVIFGSPGQLNQDNDGDGMPDPGSPNTVPFGSFVATPTGTFSNNFANVQFTGGPIGSSPIRTTQGFTPIGVSQQSIDLLDAIGSTTEFGSSILSASPALVTGFQFLDDVQVDLLIEATQADRRSMVLSAPRLTFFNGQRAWIAVTTQTAFISGLTPIVGDSVGAFQPIVSTVSEGFVLDLEAVITADRRYVTINVNFDQATLEGFRETSALQGAAGGGGFGGGGGGGQVATFSANIDLPILNGSFIRTTVCVPDKGTVMLGGQRQITEFETEAGVPVLSKIPIVNRFFTNRITSKEERTLLMLIRPEIIIKQENEDILFPGLSDRLGGAGSYLR